jgi:cellulase/cellobiase CelA1
MGEIASRAMRRRRRRIARVVGLSVGALSVGLVAAATLAGGSPDTDISTVSAVDRPPEPTTTTSTADDGSARPAPSQITVETLPPDPDPDPDLPATTAAASVTTQEAGAPTTGTTLASTTTPTTTIPGIRTTSTTTSAWENGYCIRVRVDNDGSEAVAWQVVIEFDGTIATLWNAKAGAGDSASTIFTGSDWNAVLEPGGWTTFGLCIDTE